MSMADAQKNSISSVTSSGGLIDRETTVRAETKSVPSSVSDSLKDLSQAVDDLDLRTETREDDDFATSESRSQSAEPPRISRHLSGQSDGLGPLVPAPSRRQVSPLFNSN